MAGTLAPTRRPDRQDSVLTAGRLAKGSSWWTLAASFAVGTGIVWLIQRPGEVATFNIAGAVALSYALYLVAITSASRVVEGGRRATDRFVTGLVVGAFVVALIPLISLGYTALVRGLSRVDLTFFTSSMRSVVDPTTGGALHAIVGTLEITALTTLISVPIGLMTAVYLVEYGHGWLARTVTFLVDVMTGIPSIVAGLFAVALFTLLFGPQSRIGFAGAIALAVLMIPVVVRSTEEILKLVPNELREASYALGVPKWLTIVKVVLPTSLAGIATGVTLAIARVIGETAPLLVAVGTVDSMNYNPFSGQMATLPVFVYTNVKFPGQPVDDFEALAWAGALVLVLIVMILNIAARLIARAFAPKTGR